MIDTPSKQYAVKFCREDGTIERDFVYLTSPEINMAEDAIKKHLSRRYQENNIEIIYYGEVLFTF